MTETTKYRKKPVEIEARQFSGVAELIDVYALADWCGGVFKHDTHPGQEMKNYYWSIEIPTLEGTLRATPGDWIIKGVQGEFYPCKPDIFAETYEAVDPHAAVPDAATEAKQPAGWSNEDAHAAADQAFARWSTHDERDVWNRNGFRLGAEWQKARETFISFKAIADESRAERDAALAAVDRVRAILDRDDFGDDWEHDEWVYREAAEKKLEEIETALDGAPEPEWEWEYCYRSKQTGNRWGSGSLMDAQLGAKALDSVIERRVKAGPWLPVEGESK